MAKIDTTKYNAQVTNAAAQVKISSTVFKNFIGDVKDVVDANSPEGRYAADAGSTDTYVVTLDPVPTAYVTGMIYRFKANTANTGACTVNFNSLGAKTIKKNVSDDMETGDILANQMVEMMYDGTNMQIISASSELKTHKEELATDTTPPHGMGSAAALDVESGTWTPSIAGSAVAGVNTYSTQTGNYYKIGKRVYATFNLVLTAKDPSMDGLISIAGLPFTISNSQASLTINGVGSIALPTNAVAIVGNPGTTTMRLDSYGDNVAFSVDLILNEANFSNTSFIKGVIDYVST